MTDLEYAFEVRKCMTRLFPVNGKNADLYWDIHNAVHSVDYDSEDQMKIKRLFDEMEGAIVDLENALKRMNEKQEVK